MATRTVARLYDSYDDAARVVSELENTGIPHSDVSIVSNDASRRTEAGETTHAGTGAGAGATLGTVLGGGAGVLAGIGALAIPGIGPVVAAGWLVAALTGAGVGAAAGGLIGSLTGAGVSDEEAHVYGEGVRRGGTLVTVKLDDTQVDRVQTLMDQHRAVNWQARGAEYRQSGWDRFDPAAAPYSATGAAPVAGSGLVTEPETDRLVPGGRL